MTATKETKRLEQNTALQPPITSGFVWEKRSPSRFKKINTLMLHLKRMDDLDYDE